MNSPVVFTVAAFLLLGTAVPGIAATPEEIRLLGSDAEEAQLASYKPVTRRMGAEGIIVGSLAQSAADAGVPAAAMLEALHAFGTAVDLDRDLAEGDRFFVRHERTFTALGHPIGIGRVLWAELRLAKKGVVAIHRFRPSGAARDGFYLASGQSTEPPELRLPLDTIVVSSAYGLRADPLDQPGTRGLAVGPLYDPKPQPGPKPSPLGSTPGEGSLTAHAYKFVPLAPVRRQSYMANRSLVMHAGVDLVVEPGTPIRAAGDGVVVGAHPKGNYGNWIEIAHAGKLSTVYGHLSGYAPGIEEGTVVQQGEVIGFVGNTGRSTGPHLHFEVLVGGKPTNPMISYAMRRSRLSGPDMERFTKVMARDRAEADRASPEPPARTAPPAKAPAAAGRK